MTILERYPATLRRVGEAAERAGRDPGAVRLIAVGKTFPLEMIEEAFAAGARDFGENRVQEGVDKIELFAGRPQADSATWHLIGPLQKNKVRKALAAFSVIHTLDRPDLVHRMERLMEQDWPDTRQQVLVEVNIGGEEQKAGVAPADASALVKLAAECTHLEVVGLMCIPPWAAAAESSRLHFSALRRLRNRIQDELGLPLEHLSMGMSGDFEVAIEEGATMVRVGTAIFGRRSPRV